MPLPEITDIYKPLLEVLRDGAPHNLAVNDLMDIAAEHFDLGELSTIDKNLFKKRITHAKNELKEKKLLTNPADNMYIITAAGLKYLDNPDEEEAVTIPEVSEPEPEPAEIIESYEPETESESEIKSEDSEEIQPEYEEIEPEEEEEQEEFEEIADASELEEVQDIPDEAEMISEVQQEVTENQEQEVTEIQQNEPDDIQIEDAPEDIVPMEETIEGPSEEEDIVIEDEAELEEPEAILEDAESEPEHEQEQELEQPEPEIEPEPEQETEPELEAASEPETETQPEQESEIEPEQEEIPSEDEDIAAEESEPEAEPKAEAETEAESEIESEQEIESEETYETENMSEEMNENTNMNPPAGIEDAIRVHNEELAEEVLSKMSELPPEMFEVFVIDMLSKMGYRAFHNARYTSEESGNDLIHGVIIDDKTGAPIYIHARKSSPNKTIGRADMQEFIDALSDKGGKGVFATTANFSEQAEVLANDERIMLIDGMKLAGLMIAHDFCVKVEKVYEIKGLDTESFSEYKRI